MRPEARSEHLLSITRAKAKMHEYSVPEEYHIDIRRDPAWLFTLSIALLGDLAARICSQDIEMDEHLELSESLPFSSHFFDAYLQSKLNQDINPYLLLLGAASYYLCGFPGSSSVLTGRLGEDCPDQQCLGLEDLLLWLLQGDFSTYIDDSDGLYSEFIENISHSLHNFFTNGTEEDKLFQHIENFRRTAYINGTPRQLLFADVIGAMAKKRYENSTWYSLPRYTDLTREQWSSVLQKDTFVKELWPAQHLLGEHGVFRGRSAVVQMPTSAGKTKAAEIIIRSALLSGRTSLAIVIAPFRALCHEIREDLIEAFKNEPVSVDELSDVLQVDFEIGRFLRGDQVLVVTPEKLVYVLRHTPELAENIGLVIYDEGHQFDNGTRGITYELLLTTLKGMIPEDAQSILISAVISNAEYVGRWLNGENGEVISGAHLLPTYRTLAFSSWRDRLGRLWFVNNDDPEEQEFFVPRVIEQQQLRLKGKEKKKRVFPEKTDGKDIAMYLGLKLVGNGGVAVFLGRKDTASNLCNRLIDVYDRGLTLDRPTEFSNGIEVQRLEDLHEANLGRNAGPTKSASLGVFVHHNNVPRGIRLAVEYAMKEGLVRYVICTSTLAQGVNLPIRYLIVPGIYQGAQRIKVRDFHNLIGRAGRSGIHTEGSILFADPIVYDKRNTDDEGWRWGQVKELINPQNSEPCASTLLSIFDPLRSDDRKYYIPSEPFELIQAYIEDPKELEALLAEIAEEHKDKRFTAAGLQQQISGKINIISAIESFLMSHWDDSDAGMKEEEIAKLAKETFAYFLATEEQQAQIVEFFILLAHNIEQKIPEPNKRKLFAKTLYGVQSSIEIENWVDQHIDELVSSNNEHELLEAIWPILAENVHNNSFNKCDQPDVLRNIASEWIQGKPFHELFDILSDSGARRIAGKKLWRYRLDHIVDICENAFAFDGTLVVGAVSELVELILGKEGNTLIRSLYELQKRLKYGLPSSLAIVLYELGFADRVVAMDLSSILEEFQAEKEVVVRALRWRQKQILEILGKYPAYFSEVYRILTT